MAPSREPVPAAVTTYRYLRSALLALLAAIGTSIGIETVRDGWQTSLSAYYYTPAGPVFVGALCAIGVCLIALRGFTDAEDVCLNLAGISAPMVAFVPTPEEGRTPDVDAITNNAATYLTILAAGLVVVLIALARMGRRPSRWAALGLLSTVGAWIVGVAWLTLGRDSFAANAHALAAIFTFAPFAGAVVFNTDWGVRVLAGNATQSRTQFDRAYWAVILGMVLVGAMGAVLRSWEFALLFTEVGLLTLFAVFWVVQTVDLREAHLDQARASGPASSAL
ncbi:MAG: hypothetical protein ACSLEW_12360 [Nocardioides sp.]